MYLQKQFEDVYGNLSDCHIPDATENLIEDETTGLISCNMKILSYVNIEAYNNKKQPVDCFRTNRVSITQEELMAASGTTMGQKLKNAFIVKAMESVLDESDNETNLFSGNIGSFGFQDAVIVE